MFDFKFESPIVKLTKLSSMLALPRILREAAKLRLGSFIGESPRSLSEIALHYHFDEAVLALVLDVLVVNDILSYDGDLYHSTLLSDEMDTLDQLFVGIENWHSWSNLDKSLTSGRPAFEETYDTDFFSYLAAHPEKNTNWKRWNSVTAGQWFEDVAGRLPLNGDESICDIGGGEGELLCQILEAYPDCSATLLERPEVQGYSGAAFEWVPGDMFGEIPEGNDVYILSRVFCNWDDDSMTRVLGNINGAMSEHSKLVIVDGLMPERGDADRANYAANSLSLFLMFGSRIREKSEFSSLLAKSGFQLADSEPVPSETGINWNIIIAERM